MDYTTTWQAQPPQPPPTYPDTQQTHSQLYPHHYQYSQYYPQNPNPTQPSQYYPVPPYVAQPLPAVSSYDSLVNVPHAASSNGYYSNYTLNSAAPAVSSSGYYSDYTLNAAAPAPAPAVSTSGYYSDYTLSAAAPAVSLSGYYSNPHYTLSAAVPPHTVVSDITVPSTETVQFAAGNIHPIASNNKSFVPQKLGALSKRQTKTKIVQSAYCEVCKVDCNSKDVLEQHKLGKKHKKNLEKLNKITAPVPSATAETNNPIIGPQENPQNAKAEETQKSKRKKAQGLEDLETKRRKVVEGGADAGCVRTCTICNVVCNSDTVYSYHLAGQKHAAMVKKHAAGRN